MPIKTAIIGYGRSAEEMHVPYIMELPEFELSSVCDVNPKALEAAKQNHGCKTYEDYHDILQNEEVNFAVILTRNDTHAKIACDFLEAGKNVLITKPWALNINEANQIVQTAKNSGMSAFPWLPCRWGCDLQKVKEVVARGDIGKVFQVTRSHFTFGKRVDWQTLSEYGGGYLLNWGPHLVDQPLQLINEPVSTVYGVKKQIINPGTAEDMFHAAIKTINDILIVVEFNIGTEYLPNWVIRGDKGTIYITGNKMQIHRVTQPEVINPKVYRSDYRNDIQEITLSGQLFGDHRIIYQHIAKALSKEEPYAVSPESACNLTLVLDAIRQSAERNIIVQL